MLAAFLQQQEVHGQGAATDTDGDIKVPLHVIMDHLIASRTMGKTGKPQANPFIRQPKAGSHRSRLLG